jgi:F0F1-type ATP synthase assembly protein I
VETNPQRDAGDRRFLVFPTAVGSGREGDGMVLAFELVLSTTIFAALGLWLDRTIGTTPLFAIFFGAFTLAYGVWKIVAGYDAEMAAHAEQRQPLRRGPAR